jgi:cell division septum initiation protein DivIVA
MSVSKDKTTATDARPSLSARLQRQMRGYDRAATEALFGEAVAKQAELERECSALREQVGQLQDELERRQSQERLVSKTLLTATSHATTIKDKARQEAELFLSKARAELERRTAQADRAERDRVETERELVRLRRLAQEMQTGLESFLTGALEQLSSHERAAPPKPTQTADASEALVTKLEDALKQDGAEQPSGNGGVTAPRF